MKFLCFIVFISLVFSKSLKNQDKNIQIDQIDTINTEFKINDSVLEIQTQVNYGTVIQQVSGIEIIDYDQGFINISQLEKKNIQKKDEDEDGIYYYFDGEKNVKVLIIEDRNFGDFEQYIVPQFDLQDSLDQDYNQQNYKQLSTENYENIGRMVREIISNEYLEINGSQIAILETVNFGYIYQTFSNIEIVPEINEKTSQQNLQQRLEEINLNVQKKMKKQQNNVKKGDLKQQLMKKHGVKLDQVNLSNVEVVIFKNCNFGSIYQYFGILTDNQKIQKEISE